MECDYPTYFQKAVTKGKIYLPQIYHNNNWTQKYVGEWEYTFSFCRSYTDGPDNGHHFVVTLKRDNKLIHFELKVNPMDTFGTAQSDMNDEFEQFPREWRLAVIANIMEDFLGLEMATPATEYKEIHVS